MKIDAKLLLNEIAPLCKGKQPNPRQIAVRAYHLVKSGYEIDPIDLDFILMYTFAWKPAETVIMNDLLLRLTNEKGLILPYTSEKQKDVESE